MDKYKLKSNFIKFKPGGTLSYQCSYIPVKQIPNETDVRDAKNRRVITQASLYYNPKITEIFKRKEMQMKTNDCLNKIQKLSSANNIHNKLYKALSQPLKIDKAASMMTKMGWEGGALGKSGTGIMEPIVPNAAYATTTVGFGKREPAPAPVPVKPPKRKAPRQNVVKECRTIFRTNVLSQILQFLRNDSEIELAFQHLLLNNERRSIHEMVFKINARTLQLAPTPNSHEIERLLDDIYKYTYVLTTQSEGEMPNRSLCLYKEPAPRMYVVTHHDLRYEPDVSVVIGNDDVITISEDDDDRAPASKLLEDNDDVGTGVKGNRDSVTDVECGEGVKCDEDAKCDVDVKCDAEAKCDVDVKCDAEAKCDGDAKASDAAATLDPLQTTSNPPKKPIPLEDMQSVVADSFEKTNIDTDEVLDVVATVERPSSDLVVPVGEDKGELGEGDPKSLQRYTRKELRKQKMEKRYKMFQYSKRETPPMRKPLKELVEARRLTRDISPFTREEVGHLILEYFKEFLADDGFDELKFLGPLKGLEVDMVDEFVDNVRWFVDDADYVSDGVYSVMVGVECVIGVKEDVNGRVVIYKVPKGDVK